MKIRKLLSLTASFVLISAICYAANVTINDLTSDTSPTSDDLIETENDPGGTPASRKVTIGNLFGNTSVSALSDVGTATQGPGRLLISDGATFGSVTMSGSCTITASGVTSCSTASALGDLTDVGTATQGTGRILVSDGANFASVAVSGDVTVNASGLATITSNAVGTAEIDFIGIATQGTGRFLVSDGVTFNSLSLSAGTYPDMSLAALTVTGTAQITAQAGMLVNTSNCGATDCDFSVATDSGAAAIFVDSSAEILQIGNSETNNFEFKTDATNGGVMVANGTAQLGTNYGTGTTTFGNGSIIIDSTGDQVIFKSGGADHALDPERDFYKTLATVTTGMTSLFFRADAGMTFESVDCLCDPADSGETAPIDVQECDANGDSCVSIDAAISCGNTNSTDDGSFTNAGIDAGDWVMLSVGTVSGTISECGVHATAERTRQ